MIGRHFADAQLPLGKTLGSFHVNAVPTISKAQIMALAADDSCLDKAANLIMCGPPGGARRARRRRLGRIARRWRKKPARVPLDWAKSTGNQGAALRLLAERRGDLATAERALAQITEALETFHQVHHASAAWYKAELRASLSLNACAKADALRPVGRRPITNLSTDDPTDVSSFQAHLSVIMSFITDWFEGARWNR
jgi:hypothetical protein